jgi:hypothetical protein
MFKDNIIFTYLDKLCNQIKDRAMDIFELISSIFVLTKIFYLFLIFLHLNVLIIISPFLTQQIQVNNLYQLFELLDHLKVLI